MYSSLLHLGAVAEDILRERLHQAEASSTSEPRAAQVPRRAWSALLPAMRRRWGAILAFREHSLTDYPCRLPDGTMGRVAAVEVEGEWTLVCRRV